MIKANFNNLEHSAKTKWQRSLKSSRDEFVNRSSKEAEDREQEHSLPEAVYEELDYLPVPDRITKGTPKFKKETSSNPKWVLCISPPLSIASRRRRGSKQKLPPTFIKSLISYVFEGSNQGIKPPSSTRRNHCKISQSSGLEQQNSRTQKFNACDAFTVHLDAAYTGWGVHSKIVSKAGFWTEKEKAYSIKVRELMAIYNALLLHVRNSEIKDINLHTDNMAALNSTDPGSRYAIKNNLKIGYHHVPGVKNSDADTLSRAKQPLYESAIPKAFDNLLKRQWGGERMTDRRLRGLAQQSTTTILEHEQRSRDI
ncbi:hypothetical protein BD408DRAFT_445939 [Parasitella parasitica]|nr:hypothetical protein BD408DRAFT_445939 [Parasitella parasitica]